MLATRPDRRNIAAKSGAKHRHAKAARINALIKLLIDQNTELMVMLANARTRTPTPRVGSKRKKIIANTAGAVVAASDFGLRSKRRLGLRTSL